MSVPLINPTWLAEMRAHLLCAHDIAFHLPMSSGTDMLLAELQWAMEMLPDQAGTGETPAPVRSPDEEPFGGFELIEPSEEDGQDDDPHEAEYLRDAIAAAGGDPDSIDPDMYAEEEEAG